MKTDRLLSIIIYLLNRDLVSARELAEHFEVSLRTIQRDMETINMAGIPIMTIQGPSGGYAIMDSFKLDRQYVSIEDLFFIITALHSLETSLPAGSVVRTMEKMRNLLSETGRSDYGKKSEKLHIDFSAFGGSERQREIFRVLEKAIDEESLVRFTYRDNRMERSERTVEPMTLAFKWRSWYLFGYCTLRQDYRLFRLGRIGDLEALRKPFHRRDRSFEDFFARANPWGTESWIEIELRFDPFIRPVVEEFYEKEDMEDLPDGSLLVRTRLPEDGWVYGLILSYGKYVEVISPPHLRKTIRKAAGDIFDLYE